MPKGSGAKCRSWNGRFADWSTNGQRMPHVKLAALIYVKIQVQRYAFRRKRTKSLSLFNTIHSFFLFISIKIYIFSHIRDKKIVFFTYLCHKQQHFNACFYEKTILIISANNRCNCDIRPVITTKGFTSYRIPP